MSGNGFKTLAIVVVLSMGAVLVIDRMIENGVFLPFSVSQGNEAPAQPASKAPEKKDVRSKSHNVNKSASYASTGVVGTIESSDSSPHVEIKRPDGPQGITPGMHRAQLLMVFGNPTLRVTETVNRKVVERFIYIDSQRHTRTVAVLENGRAVRSYTGAHPGL